MDICNTTTVTMEIMNLETAFDLDLWLDELVADAGPGARVFRTPVWILFGMTASTPATLQLAGNRLVLAIDSMPLFDTTLDEVDDSRFPWWWFGGGVKIVVDGEPWKLSFVKPNGAIDASTRMLVSRLGDAGGAMALRFAVKKLRDVGDGRAAGKVWRELLTPASEMTARVG